MTLPASSKGLTFSSIVLPMADGSRPLAAHFCAPSCTRSTFSESRLRASSASCATPVFRDLAQLGLLFWRQKILDRHQQSDVEMLQLAFDIEDLVELRAERRLIHTFLFRERRKRRGFEFQLHPQLIGARLRLLHPGAECLPLHLSQSDPVMCEENQLRRKKRSCERVSGRLGIVRCEKRT
jgi:hypothetical protein